MTILALIGTALEIEIVGFILIITSTKKLVYVQGAFMAGEYQDPKTDKPLLI